MVGYSRLGLFNLTTSGGLASYANISLYAQMSAFYRPIVPVVVRSSQWAALLVLSVRPSASLSVRSSVLYELPTQKHKSVEKPKLVWTGTFPGAGVSGGPIFRWKGHRSRSPDVRNLQELTHVWRKCWLDTPGPVQCAGTLVCSGQWSDGRIHIGTRRGDIILVLKITAENSDEMLRWAAITCCFTASLIGCLFSAACEFVCLQSDYYCWETGLQESSFFSSCCWYVEFFAWGVIAVS